MKLLKKLSVCLLVVSILLTTIIPANALSSSQYDSLTFNGNNIRYLFSNSPEDIRDTSGYGYLAGTGFNANERLDFEFYHHNYSDVTKRFGIVVQNQNSTAVTLTINHKASGTSSTAPSSEVEMTAYAVRAYFTSSASTVTIPANSSAFVLYVDAADNQLAFGKLSLTSPKANVYARIVYGNTSVAPSTYFNLSSQVAGTSSQFSGQVNYSQKTATFNYATSSTGAFALGEWPAPTSSGTRPFKNVNEYTTVLSRKASANEWLGGNYGVQYTITVKNAAGKRLKITPDWDGYATCADLVMCNSSGSWYTTGVKTSGSYYYALGSSSSSTFSLVITGGNCGNILCEVVD